MPARRQFFLVIFVMGVTIVLLNLLVAVMLESYDKVRQTAAARWAYMQMEMLVDVEYENRQNSKIAARRRQTLQSKHMDKAVRKFSRHADGANKDAVFASRIGAALRLEVEKEEEDEEDEKTTTAGTSLPAAVAARIKKERGSVRTLVPLPNLAA